MSEFERKELWEIRSRAEKQAEIVVNPHWKRAYRWLADAADRLDAMIARTTWKEDL